MRTTIGGLALLAAALPAPARADTSSATFQVAMTIQATCTTSTGDLDFGSYTGANADGSGSVTVNCTSGTSYTVQLNEGTGAGATTTTRKMTSPAGDTLDYTFYRDFSRSTVWSNQAVGGSAGQTNIPFWARVPSGQQQPAGAYSDTVTVTVTY